jgi:thioester reductase-like protein
MTNHTEDIRKESLIIKKWNFNDVDHSNYAEGILITGANSFIGVHVIDKLIETTRRPIHLLIRSASKIEAISKMSEAFHKWGLGVFKSEDFRIHLGDVSHHRMGLTTKEYRSLEIEVGTVIHLAMTPLYHLPYEHFKRVWIPELERMIEFCGNNNNPKSLHYTSSFNANFFQTDADFAALNSNAWQSGYAGFKWVAEQSLKNAFDQGLSGCIYDIPLVLGSEINGICPTHYSIWLILDIFLKTGLYFKFSFKIIPVDILAEIIVCNALQEKKNNGSSYVRPSLAEPVTEKMFSRLAAKILGLKEGSLDEIRQSCKNKLRFDFMMPENFYELIEKVNSLPSILPKGFNPESLPLTAVIFMSNLNSILSKDERVVEMRL